MSEIISPYIFPILKKDPPAPNDIIKIWTNNTGLYLKDLRVKRGKDKVRKSKHLLSYFLRKHTELSLERIAKIAGRRDHTSIISSLNTFLQLVEKDEWLKDITSKIEKEISDSFIPIDYLPGRVKITKNHYKLKIKEPEPEPPEPVKFVRPKAEYSNRRYDYENLQDL